MGASGSGKTTFIDAMFNHMIGVSHDDDHRFKIVNPTESEKIKVNNQVGFSNVWHIIDIGTLNSSITHNHILHNKGYKLYLYVVSKSCAYLCH